MIAEARLFLVSRLSRDYERLPRHLSCGAEVLKIPSNGSKDGFYLLCLPKMDGFPVPLSFLGILRTEIC